MQFKRARSRGLCLRSVLALPASGSSFRRSDEGGWGSALRPPRREFDARLPYPGDCSPIRTDSKSHRFREAADGRRPAQRLRRTTTWARSYMTPFLEFCVDSVTHVETASRMPSRSWRESRAAHDS
jgi:hypothetical protein